MRLPRVRIRIIRVAVAAVVAGLLAAAISGLALKRRGDRFRDLAWYYAQEEAFANARAESEALMEEKRRGPDELDRVSGSSAGGAPRRITLFGYRLLPKRWNPDEAEWAEMQRQERERKRLRGEWIAAMRAKYEHAARYPWLPVAPDPPEPK
jgi:hypothetical protein